MAEQHQDQRLNDVVKSYLPENEKGPTTSQVLAVVTLFPVIGTLLCLAGLTLAGTLIGLAVAAPLFVVFSPILVPAALAAALAVTGFWTSGGLGITARSSISWLVNYVRRTRRSSPALLEHARRRVPDTAGLQVKVTYNSSQVHVFLYSPCPLLTTSWLVFECIINN
ncbi:hypothetical protein DH2020_042721 [Rehmannia glutinosa]|uniref:Oleosin n=1 Tax=Rehmannia glutinosa TaxID=99300 RepID=A0ABR0ULM4_REHGL